MQQFIFKFRGQIYYIDYAVVLAIICIKQMNPSHDLVSSIKLLRGYHILSLLEAKKLTEYIRAHGKLVDGFVRMGKPDDDVEYIEPKKTTLGELLREQMEQQHN